MLIPDGLKYSKDHEWAKAQGKRVWIGITDFAQQQLGDVVYIELPASGDRTEAGRAFGVIESVKAVSDLVSPVTGEVVEVNIELLQHPEWVNQDPYGKGWMIIVEAQDPSELDRLLDATAYRNYLEEDLK